MDVSIFLGALLGAFFAFVGGLGLQGLVTWWHRNERRKLYRNLIAIELLHNLSTMEDMVDSLRKTKEEGFRVSETVIDRPRVAILGSIAATGEALLSLSNGEQLAVVEIVGQLNRALAEYADWPDYIGGQRGQIQLRLPDGAVQLARDVVTDQMQETLLSLTRNHIGVLVAVLNNSSEKNLSQDRLRALWRALEPTRKDWPKNQEIRVSVRPPEVEGLTEEQKAGPLVTWVGTTSDYPVSVIALKRIAEEGLEETYR